jgi:TetR/AcrR family transcriptional regulator, regulator of autoinduction and epiphytic fitness
MKEFAATATPEDGHERGDGRASRSQRTRTAVIDALHALIVEGDPKPGADRIAERAGVSSRTVFAHFTSLEDLFRATAERATASVVALLTPIDPDGPLATRVDSLCMQRARVNEEIGPLRRAAALHEPFSPALAEARRYGRQASHEQLRRVLAAELGRLGADERSRRLATLDALLSGETWDLLRTTHGLSPDEARRSVHDALHALLPHAGDSPTQVARSEQQPDEQRARIDAAHRALTAIEQRIDRLVAAIEAGSPADLLAPRLQALRTDRDAAEQRLTAERAGRHDDPRRA